MGFCFKQGLLGQMAVGWCYVGKGELQSHDEREQVLGLHKNRSIREFHLHRVLMAEFRL